MALPIALAMLALGGLLLVPSLNYASTSLKGEKIIENKAKSLYAAEAGIQDALWKLKYATVSPLPYTYGLTGVNGMSLSVLIEEVTTIAGEPIGPTGIHGGWLHINKTVTYSAGIYTYTLSIWNNGDGNMKVQEILIDFPSNLSYVTSSTAGPITSANPEVVGDPQVGTTLIWDIPSPYYTLNKGDTVNHTFRMSGPPGVQGVEGHSLVQATREDVGVVWDSDSRPYTITSSARDASGNLAATIKAGVWKGAQLQISCWQINP
ncbi:MAG: hypothetical protein Q7R57_06980 [Dehalococcoidales bacterium]|nr:hypothetical protein [Dehalococcoidales bacterium]